MFGSRFAWGLLGLLGEVQAPEPFPGDLKSSSLGFQGKGFVLAVACGYLGRVTVGEDCVLFGCVFSFPASGLGEELSIPTGYVQLLEAHVRTSALVDEKHTVAIRIEVFAGILPAGHFPIVYPNDEFLFFPVSENGEAGSFPLRYLINRCGTDGFAGYPALCSFVCLQVHAVIGKGQVISGASVTRPVRVGEETKSEVK